MIVGRHPAWHGSRTLACPRTERLIRILNMRSVKDLTAMARIREAALARFPESGFAGTTVRAIAADAGVSPALVLHHFGSKAGLREACNAHIVATMEATKRDLLAAGLGDDGALRAAFSMGAPLIRYLAWAVAQGDDFARKLFDGLVEGAVRQMALAVDAGMAHPFVGDPVPQVATMVAMQLGPLVLHDHLSRALGIDTLDHDGVAQMSALALRVLTGELFDRSALDAALAGIEHMRTEPT